MSVLRSVRFNFINDTNQGALLTYGRRSAGLFLGENLQIARGYAHFTVKDSEWTMTGANNSATSCFGTGYMELDYTTYIQVYSIQWLTYYTNGAFKEVLMRLDPAPGSNILSYTA